MPQLQLGFPPSTGFSASDFVVAQPNLEAWTQLSAWPPAEGCALALTGPEGSGKSHLAAVWAARTGAQVIGAKVAVEVLAAAPPLLVVEDVDRGFADATLFHLINLGKRPGSGLLLTARTAPSTWPTTLPDLRSRLNALPVLALDEPDDAVLEGMLQTLFRQRRILPTQELLNYLVRRIERSAEGAAEAVARLDGAASASHRPVNRRLAQELFASEPAPEEGEG